MHLQPLVEPTQQVFSAGRSYTLVPKQQPCSAHCSQGAFQHTRKPFLADSRRILVGYQTGSRNYVCHRVTSC